MVNGVKIKQEPLSDDDSFEFERDSSKKSDFPKIKPSKRTIKSVDCGNQDSSNDVSNIKNLFPLDSLLKKRLRPSLNTKLHQQKLRQKGLNPQSPTKHVVSSPDPPRVSPVQPELQKDIMEPSTEQPVSQKDYSGLWIPVA